ncbi:MAG: hypothetical protein QM831_41335 [Kofleriaceae bacterium]
MKSVVVVGVLCGVAHAEAPSTRPEAIEVDRDMTPPGQNELGFDGGAPIGDWAVSAIGQFLWRPIQFNSKNSMSTHPVERRETLTIGGAITLGSDYVLDVRMPLSHQWGLRLRGFGDNTPLDAWVAGDMTIGARLHVVTTGPIGVFVRGEYVVPTGDDHDFAGYVGWSAAWMGIVRATLPHDIVIAGQAGVRIRGKEIVVGDQTIGDEMFWGVGATVGIPPLCSWWCKPEQFKATAEIVGVVGDNVNHSRGPSPIEARIGVIGRVRPPYVIGVHLGTHVNEAVGAPELRATVDLAYQSL